MSETTRDWVVVAGLAVIVAAVLVAFGTAVTVQLLVISLGYALVALGLNVQWGYGGQFNFGVMGFMMLGAYAVVAMSYPLKPEFWHSEGPMLLLRTLIAVAIGAALIFAANRADRVGIRGKARGALIVIAWAVAYVAFRSQLDPAADLIESKAGFIGGLGLPIYFGWLFGGVLAGAVAWLIGKVCLGLRTDYLAIATIGIAEIIRALLKNSDWLTRGTLTVSPLPWPVPTPVELVEGHAMSDSMAVIVSRSAFLSLFVVVIAVIFFLLQRAYAGPWGRMMRAIRDNHVAAEAMGKNVKSRQIEIFVLGSVVMGIGGAVLSTYTQLFDPGGYMPITHTFVVWVMVIVGGVGSNLGVLVGGVLIIVAWNMSEPLSKLLFQGIDQLVQSVGLAAIPDLDARALQMRVFLLGLVITLVLRYAPRGLIPERIRKDE